MMKLLILFVFSLCCATLAHAYNNDYSSSSYQDSYSQSWESYKQQNNIKTENYVQKSWWNTTFTKVTNFLADMGSVINKALNSIGSFFSNAYHSIKSIFIKTPEVKTSDIKTSDIKTSVAQEKFVPYEERLSGKDKVAWSHYKDEQIKRDPVAQQQVKDKTYVPQNQFTYDQKERLWFNSFMNLRSDERARYDSPTAQEQAVIEWQTMSLPENADKYGFFEVLSPQVNANDKMVVDQIKEDFTLYKNIDVSSQRFIDGAADAAKRAALAGVTVAAGEAASKTAQVVKLSEVNQFVAGEVASGLTDKVINPAEIYNNSADKAIYQKIVNKVEGINTFGASYVFEKNIIGPNEANRLNREQKLGPYAVGAVAGAVTAVATSNPVAGLKVASTTASIFTATTRQQPYAAGQVEYRARIEYNDNSHPVYRLWCADIYYRVGTYFGENKKAVS